MSFLTGLTAKLEIQDRGPFMEKALLTLTPQTGTFMPLQQLLSVRAPT